MSISKYLREYLVIYYDDSQYFSIGVYSAYENQKYYSALPSDEELEALFGVSGLPINIGSCFEDCADMLASPKLPEEVQDTSFAGVYETFKNCTSLVVSPMLPTNNTYASYAFDGCSALKFPPVLQSKLKYTNYMFRNCSKLLYPASFPAALSNVRSFYEGCAVMSGEMIVRGNPSTKTDAFKNTVKPITLYGDQTACSNLAATANNGNVTWSPWYDPEPAVTDRGQGSYTTAADMTRMVRNGALAVSSYAPGRMRYQQGDIVREDEWIALVNAAKTIDPSITYSTVYSNLNKIEAAFDSAI